MYKMYSEFSPEMSNKSKQKKSSKLVAEAGDMEMEEEQTKRINGENSDDDGWEEDEVDDGESGGSGSSSVEDEAEDDDDDGLMAVDENVDGMERMNFDFEAFPPDENDLEGILDLVTQIFLRVSVNCEELAKKIIDLSPFGCVFRPAEEYEDEDIGSLVYGVASMVDLLGEEKCFGEIRDFLLQRAMKSAPKETVRQFEELFSKKAEKRVGLLINERMIHFPAQISGPAFRSLREDLASMPKKRQYDYVLMVLKIRAGDSKTTAKVATAGPSTNSANRGKNKKKKIGKAEKKRLAAAKLDAADLTFDNAEEELLFQGESTPTAYFQYPVECDVEKSSKFHATVHNGVVYRPYRRVCLLTMEQFLEFSENVQTAFS